MMKKTDSRRIAVIVAGPTCSGKSALALALGERLGGTVINADSMQVYRELRVLTARPTPEEEARLPHRLYGVSPAAEARSVAWWRLEAIAALEEAWSTGRLPILCGGTGMYLRALTNGLTEVPDPGPEAREEARALAVDPATLHGCLMDVDPDTAASLRPTDPQRLARAWEVWRGTGKGLAWWRTQPGLPSVDCRFIAIRLDPEREVLRTAIARRFGLMIEQGAIKEVRALLEQQLDPALPAMRAHGVPELAAMLRSEIDLAQAEERAVLATGRYTKRQATWFNHQALAEPEDTVIIENRIGISEQLLERKITEIVSFIHKQVDAPVREA
ncbi:tRNA (adenosine(37)-N6)-dimethylallyltransferase MiaA [Acetobacter conturbans]|uniref:tRNA dimethylallyltransferase n=1 Tax=Acetobacter conturbans TaxID=1737472 RepID=A0ABX0K279_9PROT|nr:tRNA (adenosine(37)-N6)-dimethylallyltransferase MiaA [Acetobacter conturbans]NHN88340.1 tRNA (adenosine(37)-N6)-dimethylallyltransferase MiaA [Acetobacter conturbans]